MASVFYDRLLRIREDKEGLFVLFEKEKFRPPTDYQQPRNLSRSALVTAYKQLKPGETARCHRSSSDIVVFHLDANNEAQGNYLVWRVAPAPVVDRELFPMLQQGEIVPELESDEAAGSDEPPALR